MKRGSLVVLLLLAACGAQNAGDDDDFDGDSDGPPQDAGGPDGSPSCYVDLSLPEGGQAGELVEARATWAGNGSATWTIERPDESLQRDFQEASDQRLTFVVDEPGSWKVRVDVEDFDCRESVERLLHIAAEGAASRDVVLRFLPPAGLRIAPWQQTVSVPGGGHHELDPQPLPSSLWLDGSLAFQLGERMPASRSAQLTLVPEAGGLPVVLRADGVGHFAGAVAPSPYTLEIVPYDETIAPLRLAIAPADLALGFTLDVDRGQPVAGTVVDADGVGVVGAQVALSSGGLPASFATTGPGGGFQGWARGPGELTVRVSPPDGGPGLFADGSLGLRVGAGALAIALPDAPVVPASFTVTTSDDQPLADAWIRLVPAGAGGSVQQGRLGGAARRTGRHLFGPSGADGHIDVDVPVGAYTVVVEPPASAGEVMDSQDVVVVAPAPGAYPVRSQKPSSTPVKVVGPGGEAVGNARLVAVSRGLAGVGAGEPSPVALSSDDVSNLTLLPLVRDVAYDLEVVPPPGSGLAGRKVFVPAGSPLVEVRLEKAIQLRGVIARGIVPDHPPEYPVPRVRVTAHCAGCDTPDLVLAETATDDQGTFRLSIPDPGLVTP